MRRKKGRPSNRPFPAASSRPEAARQESRWNQGLLLGLLLAVTWIVYAPSLHVPFLLDDYRTIRNNPGLREWQGLHALWQADPARVVGMVSFAANDALGGTDVWGYHVVDVAIHCLVICAVYALCRALLRASRAAGAPPAAAVERWSPLVAAALFALHPLHVAAVSYIVQRFALLAALFYVTAVWTFVEARIAATARQRGLWLIGCVAATGLALLSKQNTVTLPLALLLAEAIHVAPLRRSRAWVGLAGLAVLGSAGVSVALVGGLDATAAWARWQQDLAAVPPASHLATQSLVVWDYVRMFAWPAGLHFDHHVEMAAGLLEPRIVLAAAGHLAIVVVALTNSRRTPLPAFGLLFYYVALLVETLVPLADALAEHRTYLPDVGLCLAVGGLVGMLPGWVPGRAVAGSTVAVLLVAGTLTHARNTRWQNPVALWQRNTSLSPDKARGWSALAKWLILEGRTDEASAALARAMSLTRSAGGLDPTDVVNAVANLTKQDRLEEALALSERAQQAEMPKGKRAALLVNHGVVLAKLGRTAAAEAALREALRLRPNRVSALTNLASVLGNTGRLDEAEALYLRALALDPRNREARANLEALRRMRSTAR